MTKQSVDVTSRNNAVLSSSTKDNKLKSSKVSHGPSRLSHLLSKISQKDKKSSNYYIHAEPPFTSTPDMSSEEDGVEVSYVETDSENDDNSEDTIPTVDSVNARSRVIYVDDGAALNDSTTKSSALADSGSLTEGANAEEETTGTNITACKSSNQQVVQSTTQTQTKIATTDVMANFGSWLKQIWYIVTVSAQLLLTIFVLFWSSMILKILYDDFYNTRPKASMMCSTAEVIDEWLSLDLSESIQCNDNSNTFLQRLHHEVEVSITFLIGQFRFVHAIWVPLAWATVVQFYEEWLQKTVQNARENLNEYYEIIWTSVVKKCYEMIN